MLDGMMGPDFQKGLDNLKVRAETEPAEGPPPTESVPSGASTTDDVRNE
jgi:hypothetical protein